MNQLQEVFIAPASFAQKRLWLLSRIEPDNPAFNICSAVELHGPLDADRLEAALARVTDRHESLRTCLREENGEPVQFILPELHLPLPVEPLSEDDLETVVRHEFDRPFALETGPLLRVRCLRLAPDRHVLLSTIHHLVCDGWSMNCLVSELVAAYRKEELPPLTLQYADFAEWQQESLRGARLEHLLNYWTRQLAGVPALLPFPTDRPRPVRRTFAARVHRFPIECDLKPLARSSGTTPFMILLAAFEILL